MRRFVVATTMLALSIGYAEAKSHHRYRHHTGYKHRIHYDGGNIVAHPAGCPRSAFCGCGASVRLFGHPVRDLYLASNWFRFPRASAAPGMAAVRNHHVFVIEAVHGDGTVTAYDANSGNHLTRIHRVSLQGMTVVNPRGSKWADTTRRSRRRDAASQPQYGEQKTENESGTDTRYGWIFDSSSA